MEIKVAAVVVTYNRKFMLLENLESLLSQTRKDLLDVFVIDNASTDGTKEAIEKYIHNNQINYVNTGFNLGGAGGFSYGMKIAVEKGYDYIWVMDDDTIPQRNTLEAFLQGAFELKNDFGFLSSKVMWKDGSLCKMNKQKITKWNYLKNYADLNRIQYASFVSMFIKSNVIVELGLPYKEFFIWSDDWEYARRISKKYKCYYLPDSVVEHKCNSNIGANIVTATKDRMDRFQYLYRNDVVLYRQDGLDGCIYLFIRDISHIIKILLQSDNKRKKIGILINATIAGIKFLPPIEYPFGGTSND